MGLILLNQIYEVMCNETEINVQLTNRERTPNKLQACEVTELELGLETGLANPYNCLTPCMSSFESFRLI